MSPKRLRIKVVRAQGLPSGGSSPVVPYVLLVVDESVTFETPTTPEGNSPYWNESFDVDVTDSSKIRFGVFNSRISKGDHGYMGGVWFTVKNFIDLEQSNHTTHTLELKKERKLRPARHSGLLYIELSW